MPKYEFQKVYTWKDSLIVGIPTEIQEWPDDQEAIKSGEVFQRIFSTATDRYDFLEMVIKKQRLVASPKEIKRFIVIDSKAKS